MSQDIRELLKPDNEVGETIPKGHEARFLYKLDVALPEKRVKPLKWFNLAASIVVLLGLSIGAYLFFQPAGVNPNVIAETKTITNKTLGDVSPGLKKVEDYYLASINLELSKIKPTPETRDLFDSYFLQLDKLNKE